MKCPILPVGIGGAAPPMRLPFRHSLQPKIHKPASSHASTLDLHAPGAASQFQPVHCGKLDRQSDDAGPVGLAVERMPAPVLRCGCTACSPRGAGALVSA